MTEPNLDAAVAFIEARKAKASHCLVCNSPNRATIEALLAKGYTAPDVSRWLRAECGEPISRDSIYRHAALHLEPK